MNLTRLIRATTVSLLVLSVIGCAHKPPPPPPEEVEPLYFEHMVKFPGETMGLISRWYTGTADNWKEILTYNPGLNVYKIKKGDLVKIPDFLITKRQPLPRTYVEKFYSGASTAPQRPSDSADEPKKKTPESSGAKPGEVKAVSPEQALPSASKEKSPSVAAVVDAPSLTAPVAPEAAALSAQVRQEVDQAMQAPVATAPGQLEPTAQPRAKTREELLRELLDEGGAAPH